LNKDRRREKELLLCLMEKLLKKEKKYYAHISFIFHTPIMTVSAKLLPSLFHPFLLTSSLRLLVCFPSELNWNY
jgi:hypothetical protein